MREKKIDPESGVEEFNSSLVPASSAVVVLT